MSFFCFAGIIAASLAAGSPPQSVAIKDTFNLDEFRNPEAVLWPGYFWLWNAPLDPDVLREQLHDMAAHGAKSVCLIPMPHAFRPDSTNNSMDPDYLTPEYFDRVRIAVEEAAKLGMNWWLYDEGGWPSGQAAGKVAEGHREWQQHRLVKWGEKGKREKGEKEEHKQEYKDVQEGYADLLNPAVTDRFIQLTHEGYKGAVGEHFGKTIKFSFSDEPNVPNVVPGKAITWTPGLDKDFEAKFGGDFQDKLPLLFSQPGPDASPDVAKARIDFYDLWTAKFRDSYFNRLEAWDRSNGLASGAHLNGEEETINAVRYGFGSTLRQMRAMDVPGVDLIWRQLWPGRPNQHFFQKYASSAAHQNGTRFAFTESFCVYGNGLTPEQMRWLIGYQYIRGLNLLVEGCYPLSTRDHHMTGERPHFGPVNPMWDHLKGWHEYVARLGYALSVGKPHIKTALYYPVRDMWALGENAKEAVETHDQLAQELLATQHDFDLIDDDLLADPKTHVEGKELVAGAMSYSTIICGAVCWMQPESLARLKEFAAAGGQVLFMNHAPGTDGKPGTDDSGLGKAIAPEFVSRIIDPTATIRPACRDIRATERFSKNVAILALFNEGTEVYKGEVKTYFEYLDLQTGHVHQLPSGEGLLQTEKVPRTYRIELQPGETLILARGVDGKPDSDVLDLDRKPIKPQFVAEPRRRFVVGEHDFEIMTPQANPARDLWGNWDGKPVSFDHAAIWKNWLGEDFSGEVDYTATIEIPKESAGKPLVLVTGPIEYAATVLVDDKPAAYLLWAPWRVELPPLSEGKHNLVIRVANTLANELTSERVTKAWAEKKGPGWPSPYHKRAIEFEKESRGGGIKGPILLW